MDTRAYRHHLPPAEAWPTLTDAVPGVRYPETLNLADELVDRHVREGRGTRTAVLSAEGSLSYRDLQQRANRIGNALKRLGVQPGDRVAMRLANRPEFVTAWLAIQKLGAVAVATMPMLRARELRYVANDAEAKIFICAADRLDELSRAAAGFDHEITILATGRDRSERARPPEAARAWLEDLADAASGELDAVPIGKRDLALIAYTSGSTGVPKGTTHSPADVLASADCYAHHVLDVRENDVLSGHPTLAFTYGLGALLVFPLRFGAATALVDPFTPDALLTAVGRYGVTVLFCAATTYRLLLQQPDLETRYDWRSIRLCVSAGETLPPAVYREWHRRLGKEILDGIGSTEMFYIFVSATPGKVRAGSTGTVVPGYEAAVVDEALQPVPPGQDGLLAVRGPTGCRYWRKPERQREYVRGGWNLTGDVYKQDAEGYFWYQCRNDDMIICGGYNIAGPEVESVLLEHPAVLEAAVVASPDPMRAWVPKAFVVLKPPATGSDALAVELQEHVKRELAPYKYPRRVEFVDALPKTETGKLRRVELREREKNAAASNDVRSGG